MDLKAMRKAQKLSQSDVAKAIGCCRMSVLRWEKGALPNGIYLSRLAQLFAASPEELLSKRAFKRKTNKRKPKKKKRNLIVYPY